MRAVIVFALFAAIPLLAFASCKSDPSTSTPAPLLDAGDEDSGATLAPEAQTFLTALCDRYAPCCASSTTKTTCSAGTSAFALAKTFDAARAKTCLDALAVEAQQKRPSIFCAQSPDVVTCAAVFKIASPKAVGEACTTSDECANGDGDLGVDGLCIAKKCEQLKRGKAGDACVGTRLNGKPHLQFPTEAPPPGAAICDLNDGVYCEETARQCKARGGIGESCSIIDGACVDGAYCPADTQQCVATIAAGAACESSDECGVAAQCVTDEDTGKTTCAAFEDVDGACVRGDECDPREALQCNSGTSKCVIDVATYDNACIGSLALTPTP